jgi:hypothetical protein
MRVGSVGGVTAAHAGARPMTMMNSAATLHRAALGVLLAVRMFFEVPAD